MTISCMDFPSLYNIYMYDELACDYRLGKLKLHAGYSIFSLSVSCLIWNRNLVTLLTVCDSVESKICLYMYVVFMRQVCLEIHMDLI